MALLPTSHGMFRIEYKHNCLVLIKGEVKDNVMVRIHSRCTTGDVFGSLRCDCRLQLEESLKMISREGGILIYLNQEGRGIGLENKIKAYELQDKGLDTVEANLKLGFEADERNFEDAVRVLKSFGIKKIRLITNNPKKIEDVKNAGIEVERIPLIKRHEFNESYLETKKKKLGHLL